MAKVKKNFKVIGKIDRGNGIEEYPIFIKTEYELKKGDNVEQVEREVRDEVEADAKRYFLLTMKVTYFGPKSVTEV